MGVWGAAGLVPWNSFCLRGLDWRASGELRVERQAGASTRSLFVVLRVKLSRGRGHCQGLSSLGLPWRVAVTQFWTGTGGVPDSAG